MTVPQRLRAECSLGSEIIKLTNQQAAIVELLLLRYGLFTPTPMILEWLYPDADEEPAWADTGVGVVLFRLQLKLPSRIVAARGRGYRLIQKDQDIEEGYKWDHTRYAQEPSPGANNAHAFCA